MASKSLHRLSCLLQELTAEHERLHGHEKRLASISLEVSSTLRHVESTVSLMTALVREHIASPRFTDAIEVGCPSPEPSITSREPDAEGSVSDVMSEFFSKGFRWRDGENSVPSSNPSSDHSPGAEIATRVLGRLGKRALEEDIRGIDVHTSLSALGLTEYSVEEIHTLLGKLRNADKRGYRKSKSTVSVATPQPDSRPWFLPSLFEPLFSGKAPFFQDEVGPIMVGQLIAALQRPHPEIFLAHADVAMFQTIKEVLVCGSTNRLVAELAQVRIDDLAAPPPFRDLITRMEPLVGSIILLNTILIGVQTDPRTARWPGWPLIEILFTTFFVGELLLKIAYFRSVRALFSGPEWAWNLFDAFICLLAIFHLVVEFGVHSVEMGSNALTIVRVIRLSRLTRITRVLRLKFTKELHLMLRGLVHGMRTLVWALALLFFAVFVVGVGATIVLGEEGDEEEFELFYTVPDSMFTTFRCFIGDCTTSAGQPLAPLLTATFGLPFQLVYSFIVVFVTFGLFNLIVAVYIEHTLCKAKEYDQSDQRQRYRESVRVARLSKELLKTFANKEQHHRYLQNNEYGSRSETSLLDTDVDPSSRPISKELFMLVVQDPAVQALMDELEIPPERASLFDVFDSDGNGFLDSSELIQGLLKVRGELRKTDVVATLLSVRSLLESVRSLESKICETMFHGRKG